MTIEQWLTNELYQNGMFQDQAQAVMNIAKSDESLDAMKCRWNEDISNYPAMLKSVLMVSIKRIALEWIKSNVPQAWYRPMFE